MAENRRFRRTVLFGGPCDQKRTRAPDDRNAVWKLCEGEAERVYALYTRRTAAHPWRYAERVINHEQLVDLIANQRGSADFHVDVGSLST